MTYSCFAILVLALSAIFATSASAADAGMLDKADAEFIRKATVAGQFEVRCSEAALKRGVLSAEERAYAEKLIEDHTRMNKELASIAAAKGLKEPQDMNKDVQKKADKLAGTDDKKYAESYLECQIDEHKEAIDLFEDASKDSKDVQIRDFAGKHLPHLRAHLETAKQLEAKH